MGTTDAALALSFLESAVDHGVDFAMLHRLDDVLEGRSLSDLDLAIRAPSDVHTILRAGASIGIGPMVLWRSDVATLNLFMTTSDLAEGVQVDCLCDDRGVSVYGIRTAPLVEGGRPASSATVPEVAPLDSHLYRVRKRIVKKNLPALAELRDHCPAPTSQAVARANELFSPVAARQVVHFLQFGGMPEGRALDPDRMRRDATRLARRFLRPAGAWVHVPDEEVAAGLGGRLQRFLRHVSVVVWPSGGAVARARLLPEVLACRWRAGIAVSHGRGPVPAAADLTLSSGDVDRAAEELTAQLFARSRDRLAGLGGASL
jgi:hypothetical protein